MLCAGEDLQTAPWFITGKLKMAPWFIAPSFVTGKLKKKDYLTYYSKAKNSISVNYFWVIKNDTPINYWYLKHRTRWASMAQLVNSMLLHFCDPGAFHRLMLQVPV